MTIPGVANYLARSAFGIGLAVGLMLSLICSPFTATASARTTPPCDGTMSVPPGVQAWINLQCQVRQATFGDQIDPGTGYKFDKSISAPGKYAGVTIYGDAVTFHAVYAIKANIAQANPDLAQQGVEGYMVIGRLGGPAGKAMVSGIVVYPNGLSADNGYLLFVNSVLSQSEYDVYAMAARIQAGPRVVDSTNGTSQPLEDVEEVNALWGFASDPATLFCGCETSVAGGVDVQCVKDAYDIYNTAVSEAHENVAICVGIVVAVFVVCMVACAAAASWVPLIAFHVCLLCIDEQVLGYLACGVLLKSALDDAKEALLAALRTCGVSIYEI